MTDREKIKLLLKFDVEDTGSRAGDGAEGSFRQNNRRSRKGRRRNINDLHLNSRRSITNTRRRRTYTSHQVLSPAGSAIVPNTVSGGSEKIIRRKLRGIVGETLRR